mmetsp:Transcript_29225/g.63422  ORF Transcript_29225/g.63422 Transcript_29225/m.63422 type:complete len:533 (-) Transcript_29225:396-1994(-)
MGLGSLARPALSSTSRSSSSSSCPSPLCIKSSSSSSPRWLLLAAAGASLVPGAFAAASDFQAIIPQYCHIQRDWGALPERPEGVSELRQVQVFIRHGSRTQASSDYCWHGDQEGEWTCSLNYLDNSVQESSPLTASYRAQYMPGRNALKGNCMTGQLVSSGFEMEYNNGQRLKDAYMTREGFLPATLAGLDLDTLPDVLRFRSTDVPRTKQSGMALLSAMYPSASLGSLPYLPLNTMDIKMENMLVNAEVCPIVTAATKDYWNSWPRRGELLEQCKKLDDKKDFSNNVNGCFLFLQHLIDCLMSRMCPTVPFSQHNTTVPEHFSAEDWTPFQEFWELVDQAQWDWFKAMAEAGATASFAEDLYSQAKLAAAGNSSTPKFLLWSGHDTGPMEPMYATFDLRAEAPYWPTFASMLVLELWATTDGDTVARWISNGKVQQGPMPWSTFAEKAESIIARKSNCGDSSRPSDGRSIGSEIGTPPESREDTGVSPLLLAVVAVAGAIVGAALAGVAICMRQRATKRKAESSDQVVLGV